AGKQKPIGDRAKSCLQDISHAPTLPVLWKFCSGTRLEPGAIRVPRGKANDPDVASTLIHGTSTKSSLSVSSAYAHNHRSLLREFFLGSFASFVHDTFHI
ncbi:hypothetical protein XENORESO_014351, partial [Xenotaenia resolanae]